ncbi:replication factor C small subunit 2, partial [Haloferax volcanii]
SRCFPVPMPAPDDEALEALLADILDAEGVDYDAGGLQFLTDASNGNVRKAVLSAQRTATEADEVTMSTVHAALGDVGFDDELKTLLINAREGDIKDARKTLTTLLDDEGYEGQELLRDILRVADSTPERFADGELARLHELAGQVDLDISTGIDDRLHITHLLTSWGTEVRGEA